MEPYSSFLGQNRGSPVATTAFHPHRMVMGAAAKGDHHINLYTCTNEPAAGTAAAGSGIGGGGLGGGSVVQNY